MKINSVQSPSFKAFVPITYYAKNPVDDKYVRVMKPENIKKCQSFVVRNLNGTAKSNKNDAFVDNYAYYDSDYRRLRAVRSVYDYDSAKSYIITGKDVDTVTNLAKPIGMAKSESIERTGRANSFEAKLATNDYFKKIRDFLRYTCRQVRNQEGEKLSMNVYFDPKYKRDGSLKGFDYVGMKMVKEGEV